MKHLLFAAALTLPLCAAQEPNAKPAFFPLGNHSWWEYAGDATLEHNSGTQAVRLRMEVIEVLERGEVRAAWVRGGPLGLLDSTDGANGQMIARIGNRMYLVESPRSAEVRVRMQNPADKLEGLFKDSEFLLDTALPTGLICLKEEATRQSCWTASANGNEYQISRHGPSGSRVIRFRAGIGIIGLAFENKAAGESGDLRLTSSDVAPEH